MQMKKRFIAGAVCPRCGDMDKLTLSIDEKGVQQRECISCDFTDEMVEQERSQEVPTRVNQPRIGEQPLAHEDEISVVTLVDPKLEASKLKEPKSKEPKSKEPKLKDSMSKDSKQQDD